jgi:hypothetical protein
MNKRTVWIAIAGSTVHRDAQRLVLSDVLDRPNVGPNDELRLDGARCRFEEFCVVWV